MSTGEALTLSRFRSAREFLQRAEAYLTRNEAVHCLPIGICSNLIQSGKDADDVYLAIVEQSAVVVAAAVMTPPWPLVLSLILPEALASEVLQLLARDLRAIYGQLSGVNGPVPLSRRFAEEWGFASGQPYHLGVRERI